MLASMPQASAPPPDQGEGRERLLILIPVYNDWNVLGSLLPRLDAALADARLVADLLVVDDGSTQDPSDFQVPGSLERLGKLFVLSLKRNLGHQRAIAIGLAYAEAQLDPDVVVVMDSDGEDEPLDVPRLVERLHAEQGKKIVFAERTRRSESWMFCIFYALYKVLHFALVGRGVRVGNFSAIPRRRLSSLVVVAELWNHYAAAVVRSRQPSCAIPTRRARRLSGRSSMDFVGLVTHGLSAISVFGDVVGVRLLLVSIVLAGSALGGIVGGVAIRLATNWAIPGWATLAVGLSMVLLAIAIMMMFVFSFVVLGSRQSLGFIPCRDYALFVEEVRSINLCQVGSS